jgi:putative ABC transport system ATP-binding protein
VTAIDTPVAVRATDLRRSFGTGPTATVALRDVSLTVRAGTWVSITGASGSGKSTLLHCLAGLDRVDAGRVEVAGVVLSGLRGSRLTRARRAVVGMVFQEYNLIGSMTVAQNIRLGVQLAGAEHDDQWIDTIVEMLGLAELTHRRPAELSGGQQQRVAVARSLASRPAVICADEPTGALDSDAGSKLLALVRRVVDELGQTVLMVTHEAAAAAAADTSYSMSDGVLS